MNDYGEMLDNTSVRFERLLPGPIERVWAYLTEGDKRARWLCGGETELTPGGHVDMLFHNASLSRSDAGPPPKYADMPEKLSFTGTVVRCEPPTLLTYTWHYEDTNSEVTYELSEQADKVLLVLTHRRLTPGEEVLSVNAGWHTHLDILVDILAGEEPRPFWTTHTGLEAEYEERLG